MTPSAEEIAKLRITLNRVSFLETIRLRDLDPLLDAVEARDFAKDEVIFRQGDAGDALYIIASGAVEVSRRFLWIKKVVAVRRPGEFVGEMALISKERRNATITGRAPGMLYRIPKEAFNTILMNNEEIREKIEQVNARRKQEDEAAGR